MDYQKFIIEVLNTEKLIPTKEEMQFAYVVLYCGFGLSIKESIKESMSI
tara:strand:+ start:692 stop:838 length:147 start_codon:yes stop_codon:yes gene_type:complete